LPGHSLLVGLTAAGLLVIVAGLLLPGAAGFRDGTSFFDGAAGLGGGSRTSAAATASPGPDTTWGPRVAAGTVAAPTPTPVPTPDLSGYVWPLKDARVTLPFGPSRQWGDFVADGVLIHDGVDMATACGDKIRAAHDGVVLAASRHFDDFLGWQGDLTPYYNRLTSRHSWGYLPIVIVIDDGNGLRSIYAHESSVTVKVGEHVKAGQIIGIEGKTGRATGCHLHYGLFNPSETATFDLKPEDRERLLLPKSVTARINPLLVLPYRHEIEEMRALRPADEAAWQAAHATARPTTSPTPSPSPSPSPLTPPTWYPSFE
jgi:murein DD-endopeptidase MepM/ murein hydrolase activator NlpD